MKLEGERVNVIVIGECLKDIEMIKRTISEQEGIWPPEIFNNPFEGLHYMKENIVDVIFIEVGVKLIHEIILYKKIMEIYEGKHPIPKIVFYGDEDHVSCAVKAYETGAMDYMIRPLSEEKIEQLFHLSQKENLL
ncbi:MAG: hypothetical protein K0S30_1266 [Clostridia bacterium]|jgi:two-component SAPR family response regulator|nr:hypothetical protein [Clostridia bacterium]